MATDAAQLQVRVDLGNLREARRKIQEAQDHLQAVDYTRRQDPELRMVRSLLNQAKLEIGGPINAAAGQWIPDKEEVTGNGVGERSDD